MENNCTHPHNVWKGQICFCLVCSEQTDFYDMLNKVILPNGKVDYNARKTNT